MPAKVANSRIAAVAMTLRSCQIFVHSSSEDLALIAAFVIPKRLDRGEYLYREGEPSEGFFVVQRGSIHLHRVSGSGKEQFVHVFRAGQAFAEATLTTEGGYLTDARAAEASSILLIPRLDFLALLRHRPELAFEMFASMSHYVRILIDLVADLTLKDVETRLIHWLLKRCPRPLSSNPVTIHLDRTKRTLAAEIGTVSETLSRTFSRLRLQKLIQVEQKAIIVLHPRKLEGVLLLLLGEA